MAVEKMQVTRLHKAQLMIIKLKAELLMAEEPSTVSGEIMDIHDMACEMMAELEGAHIVN
tara:strand:+ start:1808 stop:1987 length:180 start_codon:yes stop_codon:yes gene_type:complete